MIDIEKVKKALNIKTNKGIESALKRMCEKLPDNEIDLFWIIRWLDNHGIKYIYAEDIIMG